MYILSSWYMHILFVYYILSILTVSFIFQLCISLCAAYLLNKYINKKMIESMKTKTFRMDKEKWRLISINGGEKLEGFVSIVASDPKLGERKVHRRGIQQGLESSVLVFPECTASLFGPRLQNVFCKYWHLRKWREECSPNSFFLQWEM